MIQFSPDDQDQDPLLASYLSGKRPLSKNIAGIARGAATAPSDLGFSPDDPDDNWLSPPLDRAAFRVSGASAAPQASVKPSAGSGNVLLGRGPASMPPPERDTPPAPAPPVQMAPPPQIDHAAPTDIPPEMRQEAPAVPQAPVAVKPIDQTQDQIGKVEQDLADKRANAPQLKSNWAQRLGMAVLAAGKLAPYAQQIIHPKYTEQMGSYQAGVASDEAHLKALGQAETALTYGQQRQAKANELAAEEQQRIARSKPHFGQLQIDSTQAHLFPFHPKETDGSVWVDKAEALEKEKEIGKPITLKEGEQLIDPVTHLPLAGTTRPVKITSMFEQIKADHPDWTAEQIQDFEQKGKAEPSAKAMQDYMRTMSKVSLEGLPLDPTDVKTNLRSLDASKTLTPEERADAHSFMVAHTTPAQAATAGIMRMEMVGNTRAIPVIDSNTGNMEITSAANAINHPGQYIPAAEGAKQMSKQAVFDDLHYNINSAKNAIGALSSIDAPTRAALANQLQEADPKSALSAFLHGEVGTALTPEQRHAVQALAQLSENAMSLRSVAGMGQGAADLRDAIRSVLPSAKSPDKKYALEQLNNFEQVVHRLEGGVPGVGAAMRGNAQRTGGTPGGGKIIVTDPNGLPHPFDTQAQADAFKKLAGIK